MPDILRETGSDQAWIGEDGLWVEVSWVPRERAARVEGTYRYKYATVTLADGEVSSRPGPPTIEVRPVDGSGEGSGSFGGYTSASGQVLRHWWPTVLEFSAKGCWVVTQKSAGTVVRFRVQVR